MQSIKQLEICGSRGVIILEIRQLRYFVAAAETGNISRAAQQLNVSQPPVSRQIKALENELGFDLFNRTVRGVDLTAAGQKFFQNAQRILADTEAAKRSALAANRGEIGMLNVAFTGSVIFRAVPFALNILKQQYRDVHFQIRRMNKNEQQDALLNGSLQIGFGRYYDRDPAFEIQTLTHEPVLLAVSKDEGLEPGQSLSLEQAVARPVTLFPAAGRPNFADHLLTSLTAAGVPPRVAHESEDATTALVQTMFGQCRAFVPASTAALTLDGIQYHSISDWDLQVPINCIYRSEDRSPILKNLLKLLAESDFSGLKS